MVAQWPCPQLSPPTRTPSSSSPGRQGMAGVHPLPFPRGSPAPPGCSLSLSPSQSSSGVAHLCTEFSTFSACVPPTWLTVAPMGPRFPPGVTPPPPMRPHWPPPAAPPGQSGPVAAARNVLPNSGALTFFPRNAPGLGTAGQSCSRVTQEADGTSGGRSGNPRVLPPPRDPHKPGTATTELCPPLFTLISQPQIRQ